MTLLFTPPHSSSVFLAIKGFDLNRETKEQSVVSRGQRDSKNSLFFFRCGLVFFSLSLSLFFSFFVSPPPCVVCVNNIISDVFVFVRRNNERDERETKERERDLFFVFFCVFSLVFFFFRDGSKKERERETKGDKVEREREREKTVTTRLKRRKKRLQQKRSAAFLKKISLKNPPKQTNRRDPFKKRAERFTNTFSLSLSLSLSFKKETPQTLS